VRAGREVEGPWLDVGSATADGTHPFPVDAELQPATPFLLTSSQSSTPSKTPKFPDNHLKRRLQKRRVHIPVANVADHTQLVATTITASVVATKVRNQNGKVCPIPPPWSSIRLPVPESMATRAQSAIRHPIVIPRSPWKFPLPPMLPDPPETPPSFCACANAAANSGASVENRPIH